MRFNLMLCSNLSVYPVLSFVGCAMRTMNLPLSCLTMSFYDLSHDK